MKTASIIFLLVLLVSTQTPLGQVFKLPLLVEHYLKHQDQNGVSLTGFLQDHYSIDHNDADLPEDEQLPFKNITLICMGYAIVPTIVLTNGIIPVHIEKKLVLFCSLIPQQHLARIFHPPRIN